MPGPAVGAASLAFDLLPIDMAHPISLAPDKTRLVTCGSSLRPVSPVSKCAAEEPVCAFAANTALRWASSDLGSSSCGTGICGCGAGGVELEPPKLMGVSSVATARVDAGAKWRAKHSHRLVLDGLDHLREQHREGPDQGISPVGR